MVYRDITMLAILYSTLLYSTLLYSASSLVNNTPGGILNEYFPIALPFPSLRFPSLRFPALPTLSTVSSRTSRLLAVHFFFFFTSSHHSLCLFESGLDLSSLIIKSDWSILLIKSDWVHTIYSQLRTNNAQTVACRPFSALQQSIFLVLYCFFFFETTSVKNVFFFFSGDRYRYCTVGLKCRGTKIYENLGYKPAFLQN